jgi:hypothetical protein
MNYYININQIAIESNKLDLHPFDAIILSGLQNMFTSKHTEKKMIDNKVYYWVSTSKLMSDLPLLSRKAMTSKRAWQKRLTALEEAKIIVRYIDESIKSFYTQGELWDCLISTNARSQGMNDGSHPPMNDGSHPPMNDGSHYPINELTQQTNNPISSFSDFFKKFDEIVGSTAYWRKGKNYDSVAKIWSKMSEGKRGEANNGLDGYMEAFNIRAKKQKDLTRVNVKTYLEQERWNDLRELGVQKESSSSTITETTDPNILAARKMLGIK